MGKRMLRSTLTVAFSAVVAFGALSGLSGAKGDDRADSHWGPSQVVSLADVSDVSSDSTSINTPADSHWGP